MAAQDDDNQQEINSPEETTFHDCENLDEHEDFTPESDVPRSLWEELHELLENLRSKFNLENLLQEKPDDLEDKTAISRWLDKLINFVRTTNQEEEIIAYSSRGLDASKNEDVAKLERFKVKNLGTGANTVNKDKKW